MGLLYIGYYVGSYTMLCVTLRRAAGGEAGDARDTKIY
jgi:hypothetical protein